MSKEPEAGRWQDAEVERTHGPKDLNQQAKDAVDRALVRLTGPETIVVRWFSRDEPTTTTTATPAPTLTMELMWP